MDGIYAMHSLHGRESINAHEPINQMHPSETLHENWCNSPMELAQAYVRPQRMERIFPPEEGLRKGTIFPSLYQPYIGGNKR